MGYSLWVRKESDSTEHNTQQGHSSKTQSRDWEGGGDSLEGEEGGCMLTSTASAFFEFVPLKLSAWGCFSSWEEERERGLRRNGLLKP